MILTYRYRLKDGRGSDRNALRAQARIVNFIWNFLCETQREAERRRLAGLVIHWPTAFDLINLTAGCSKELGVHSDTVGAICQRFVQARAAIKRCPGWRSARRNLDWIPVSHAEDNLRLAAGRVRFRRRHYRLWLHRPLPTDARLKMATFAADARGRWYCNLVVETAAAAEHGAGEVGIDLGLLTVATLSTGAAVANPRHTARHADALARALRARRRRRAQAIYAKIANSRRDHLHKASTAIMRANRRVIVGNVSASRLARGRFAKSVMDAGWTTFREMRRYKALKHGVEYREVDEAFTSRTCSACGVIPASSPKGLSGLGVRRWICEACGTPHDRDVNAALNILRVGAERRPPAVGIAA